MEKGVEQMQDILRRLLFPSVGFAFVSTLLRVCVLGVKWRLELREGGRDREGA